MEIIKMDQLSVIDVAMKEGLYASLRFAVYISWFTAAPVYASRFTFHGLRYAVYGFAGLHFIVDALRAFYGFAGLRCAVDITLLTPFGLFGLVI
jgi:hypothetical protein